MKKNCGKGKVTEVTEEFCLKYVSLQEFMPVKNYDIVQYCSEGHLYLCHECRQKMKSCLLSKIFQKFCIVDW